MHWICWDQLRLSKIPFNDSPHAPSTKYSGVLCWTRPRAESRFVFCHCRALGGHPPSSLHDSFFCYKPFLVAAGRRGFRRSPWRSGFATSRADVDGTRSPHLRRPSNSPQANCLASGTTETFLDLRMFTANGLDFEPRGFAWLAIGWLAQP